LQTYCFPNDATIINISKKLLLVGILNLLISNNLSTYILFVCIVLGKFIVILVIGVG